MRTKKKHTRRRRDKNAWTKKQREHEHINEMFRRLHEQEGASRDKEGTEATTDSRTEDGRLGKGTIIRPQEGR